MDYVYNGRHIYQTVDTSRLADLGVISRIGIESALYIIAGRSVDEV